MKKCRNIFHDVPHKDQYGSDMVRLNDKEYWNLYMLIKYFWLTISCIFEFVFCINFTYWISYLVAKF